MKPVLMAALRPRICVGSSETLAVQTTACPQCKLALRLMWPEYILQIPAHRVIHLDCPWCATSFSLIAIDLTPVVNGELRYAATVVNQLS